ncbi:MAG: hypothetical protein NAG76_02200 [Candidatus Pristimantibacillus lignocellulolyticus]|uniref:Uncharacterized protein n=1 Tax=Candidatus Pristimantibacillus lignocellulolyticus TaxID=2994561 RepID=A0A9J6ZFY3_9BACL|nr:MAG: hypothetical protein NAG76_02200 [Candidatus Pristimantibacillus lignocellulolyticus]
MNASPHGQNYAYRRNPTRTIHASTFQPQQFGHSHGYTVIPSQHSGYSTTSNIQNATSTSQVTLPVATTTDVAAAPPKPNSSGFSLASLTKYANVDELKGLVDRFGGLDGILSTVTTVQKVVSTVGQIAPMVKVFAGTMGKGNKSAAAETTTTPARRRSTTNRTRRTRTTNSNRRTTSAPSSRKSTPLMKRQGGNR